MPDDAKCVPLTDCESHARGQPLQAAPMTVTPHAESGRKKVLMRMPAPSPVLLLLLFQHLLLLLLNLPLLLLMLHFHLLFQILLHLLLLLLSTPAPAPPFAPATAPAPAPALAILPHFLLLNPQLLSQHKKKAHSLLMLMHPAHSRSLLGILINLYKSPS